MSDPTQSISAETLQSIPITGLQNLFRFQKGQEQDIDNEQSTTSHSPEPISPKASEVVLSNPSISSAIDPADSDTPFRLRPRALTCLDELESDDEIFTPIKTTPKPGEKRKPGRPKKEITLIDLFKIPRKRGRPKNDSMIDKRHIVTGPRKPRGRPRKIIDPLISVNKDGSSIISRESTERTPTAEPKATIKTKAEMKSVMVEFEAKDVLKSSSRIDSGFDSDDNNGYISEDSSKDWRPKPYLSSGIGQHGNRRGRPRKYPKVEKDPSTTTISVATVPRPRGRPRKHDYVPKDPSIPPRPRGRPKKNKMLDVSSEADQSPILTASPKSAFKKVEIKKEESVGIVEFNYADDIEDDLTKFVFVKGEEPVKKAGPGRKRNSELEKQREIIHSDVFSSPKKQKMGSISLSGTPSPSKKGILNLPGSSPTRTPNGRAGSPRKMNKRQLQDQSARKKATRILYSQLMDDGVDDDDEDYEEEKRLAERIIKESKSTPRAAPSPFNTPRKKTTDINLPTNTPDFVPTPLPTAEEEESFFESKYLDKALFLDGPEGYFDQHRTRVKTSNHSMVQAPQLEYDEFNSLILLSGFLHHKEKEKLINTYKEMYTQWYFELSQGFSLMFFGVGSKRRLLLDYVETYLTQMVDSPTIVINGYNPATAFKEILMTIVSTLHLKKIPKRLGDLVDYIVEYYSKKDSTSRLILLIHNIDGPGLRDEKTQIYLSKLASVKQIFVLASIDHINAPLLWDSVSLNNFNFLWHNTTTFADYLTETSFQDIMTLGQTQKSAGSKGAKYVLSSLTTNSRSLYRVLVSNQLQNMEDDMASKRQHGAGSDNPLKGTIKHALEYRNFYTLCAEEFISSNEINFRTMLMEFVEHKMAVLTKDQTGTEMVFIPFSLEELHKLLEDELL